MSEYLRNFSKFVDYYKKKQSNDVMLVRPENLTESDLRKLRNFPKLNDAYNKKWKTANW